MCELFNAECEVCHAKIPMHSPEDHLIPGIVVRCNNHPPLPEDRRPFTLFTETRDRDFCETIAGGEKNDDFVWGNVYVTYVGSPESLGYLDAEGAASYSSLGLPYPRTYGVGEDGGIHPNADWRYALDLPIDVDANKPEGHDDKTAIALRYSLDLVVDGDVSPNPFSLASCYGQQRLGTMVRRGVVRREGATAGVEAADGPGCAGADEEPGRDG